MFWVYILENPQGRLYIGQTEDLEDRLARHNRAGSKFTTSKGPWKVIYRESYETRQEALAREKHLKSFKNSRYIKTYIVTSE